MKAKKVIINFKDIRTALDDFAGILYLPEWGCLLPAGLIFRQAKMKPIRLCPGSFCLAHFRRPFSEPMKALSVRHLII